MTKPLLEFEKKVFEVFLEPENIQFLSELNDKIEKNTKEISELETKKEKIANQISERKRKEDDEPKGLREYIGNAESVLESIEVVYKNLTDLQNSYRDIEKSLLLTTEKDRLNLDNSYFEAETKVLVHKIELAKIQEYNIEKDNEKNYYIINNFLEEIPQTGQSDKTPVNFYGLTLDNLQDHLVLKIREKRVELPYTKREIEQFMEKYPNDYTTVQDVITKEFMINISMYNKHPVLSRFRECYYLCRNKEMMPILDSFNYAKSIMFRSEINPYIIAAVKSKKQLEDYIKCLEEDRLDDFKHFKIIFEVNPLSV